MIHLHWYWISLWYSSGTTITYYIVKCECKSSVQHSYLYQIALQCFHFKLLEKPKHGKINVIWLIVLINGILFIWKILTSDPFLPLHLHDWDQYRRKLSPPGNKEWLYKLWKKNLKFQPQNLQKQNTCKWKRNSTSSSNSKKNVSLMKSIKTMWL